MDELELDDWYTQRREKLEASAFAALEKGDSFARERFNAAYRTLIAEYQKRQRALMLAAERRGIRERTKRQQRARYDAIRDDVRAWLAWREKSLHQAWFNLKYWWTMR